MNAQAPPKRPLRKPGTAAPKGDTKARVLVLSEDVTPPSSPFGGAATADDDLAGLNLESCFFANNRREAMINNRWQRQAFEAGLVDSFPSSRPSTAPSARSRSVEPCNEARRRYQESSVANLDVLAYRHSGGICSSDWKVRTGRRVLRASQARAAHACRTLMRAAALTCCWCTRRGAALARSLTTRAWPRPTWCSTRPSRRARPFTRAGRGTPPRACAAC